MWQMVMRFGNAACLSKKSFCRIKINQQRDLFSINQRWRLRRQRWSWTFRLWGCSPGRPFDCRQGGPRRARLQGSGPDPHLPPWPKAWRRWPSGCWAQRTAPECRGRSRRRSWYLQRPVPLLDWCHQTFSHLIYPRDAVSSTLNYRI